ncbi:MAG TPA: head GIN domain-containing protein, partial [Nitrosopumilaceae archaeon]|nr:head GIN domain-containing protein [Nitrosopumilaceae archaeon]
MKKIIYVVIAGIISLTAVAQTTEMRPITDFNKLDVSGVAHVKLTQGETVSVKVEAEQKTMKNIIVMVQDNKLIIKTEGEIDEEFTVYVNYKTLNEIGTSGASQVSTENTLNAEKLSVTTSGASKASLDVVLKDIQTNVSGASTLILSGATETHTSEVSGAASLKSIKLSSLITDINTSGAATAKINVNKKLTANASGASSIRYSGQPAETTVSAGKASTIEGIGMAEGNLKLNDIDTTRIRFGKKKYIIIDEDHHQRFKYTSDFNHWAGIDLGINSYVGHDGNIN